MNAIIKTTATLYWSYKPTDMDQTGCDGLFVYKIVFGKNNQAIDRAKSNTIKVKIQRDIWKRRALAYEAAIRETLAENGHLADGEKCTLIKLKRALAAGGAK
jgi:hypothetical protein